MNGPHQSGSKTTLRQRIFRFAPGLEALFHYQPAWLRNDVAAGLSVAAVALPVGVAYADLVGVPAVYGIYSAIFPLLVYALFGSSRQLMVGPDAPLCLLVAASLGLLAGGDPARYLSLMLAMTLLTGVLLVIAGLFRLGFIANFLSQPILTGYLTGAALIIMVGQLPKLFGISIDAGGFFPKVAQIATRLDQVHLPTLILGGSMLIVLIVLKRIAPSLPGALIVSAVGGIAVGKIDELREEFRARGIRINFAGLRHDLMRFFKSAWTQKRYEAESRFDFNTMASAVEAFQKHRDNKPATGTQ